MEFAKTGVFERVRQRDYLSLISNLNKVKQLVPDNEAHELSRASNVLYYVSREGNVRLGLGRSSKDDRLFYWVFGPEESSVLRISDFIASHINTDPRRN